MLISRMSGSIITAVPLTDYKATQLHREEAHRTSFTEERPTAMIRCHEHCALPPAHTHRGRPH